MQKTNIFHLKFILGILIIMPTVICGQTDRTAHKSNGKADTILSSKKLKSNLDLLDYNEDKAMRDLSEGKVILLLPGTIGCPPPTKSDFTFEEKYQLQYSCPGCNSFGNQDLKGYNMKVFKYLDKKYGPNWRAETRKDVIGL